MTIHLKQILNSKKILIGILFFLFFPFGANAQNTNVQFNSLTDIGAIESIGKPLVSGTGSLTTLFNQAVYVMLAIAIALAIFMIIRGGYSYIMSADNGGAKTDAKGKIQAAFGGLLLALGAFVILQFINPEILKVQFDLPELERMEEAPATEVESPSDTSPVVIGTPIGGYFAEFTNINNPNKTNASADGVIVLNGNTYAFRSGGGGNGYLPAGTYSVSNGRLRTDVSSMTVGGYGYSFDLNDAYDARVNKTRTLLRIHPDGGGPGTAGCIGIQGDRETQERFFNDLNAQLKKEGGSYQIKVGGK